MPGGRPPKIDKPVAERDGKAVTAGQMVIERVRATWAPWESAAGSAGITRQTLHTWRRNGGLARAKQALGQKLTRNERLYAEFLDDLEKAEEEAHLRTLGNVHREAQGGYPVTKTVTKIVGGKEVEKVVTEETARPVWQASAWLCERRRPADYGRRLELTGKDGEPLIPKEERAGQLAESASDFLKGAELGRQLAVEEGATDGMGRAASAEETTDA